MFQYRDQQKEYIHKPLQLNSCNNSITKTTSTKKIIKPFNYSIIMYNYIPNSISPIHLFLNLDLN